VRSTTAAGARSRQVRQVSPRFDPEELKHLNARLLHHLPFEEARKHLAAIGLGDVDAAVWDAGRANVEKVEDVALWQSGGEGAR
jgi:glutamyl-tRNA synthetase